MIIHLQSKKQKVEAALTALSAGQVNTHTATNPTYKTWKQVTGQVNTHTATNTCLQDLKAGCLSGEHT